MNIRECYEQMGADYADVLGRFGNDAMIKKYLLKYCQNGELAGLKQALEREQYEEAYTCAHNMKGFGLNLGLTQMAKTSGTLCEELRKKAPREEISLLVQEVEEAYEAMKAAVSCLDV